MNFLRRPSRGWPRRWNGQLPFLLIAPGVVVVLGLLAAAAMAILGMIRLHAQSDEAATLRSTLLSRTLATRLEAAPRIDHATILERAARRSGAELLLVRDDGTLLADASLTAPSREQIVRLLVRTSGETRTELGRTRYSVAPLSGPSRALSLVTFVSAPATPLAARQLLTSVAALATLLIGAAGLVAFAFARNVSGDVTYVREQITTMAHTEGPPDVHTIPVRSADQVGLLTVAFNELAERFRTAERAYRRDLAGALAYDRDRSAFLAALSHELRTPLNAILGFTDVLLSEVDGPLAPEERNNLRVVHASGRHLASLIDDILDLSAMESGELRLSRDRVDVYDVAQEVVREAELAIQSKPVILQLEGEASGAWIDRRRVRQILGNVVGNAVKFTAEGCVRIQVIHSAESVAIEVSDTGPGIALDDQSSIFDEYKQAGDVRARRVGTGLGLAIARRLVEMHGGTISVDSTLGEGSRFSIQLPREATTSTGPPPFGGASTGGRLERTKEPGAS